MKLWFHDTYNNLKRICNTHNKDDLNEKCLADYEY